MINRNKQYKSTYIIKPILNKFEMNTNNSAKKKFKAY